MAQQSWNSHPVPWNTIAAFPLLVPEIMSRSIKRKGSYFCLERNKTPWEMALYIRYFVSTIQLQTDRHCPRLSQRNLASCHILSCLDLCQLSRADALKHLSHSSNNGVGKFRRLEHLHLSQFQFLVISSILTALGRYSWL